MIAIISGGIRWTSWICCEVEKVPAKENTLKSKHGCSNVITACLKFISDRLTNFVRLKPVALLLTLSPTVIDTLTNIWYLLQQRFYSDVFFYLAVAALAQSVVIFISKLIFLGAVPMHPFTPTGFASMANKVWGLTYEKTFFTHIDATENKKKVDLCFPFLYCYGLRCCSYLSKNQNNPIVCILYTLVWALVGFTQAILVLVFVLLWPLGCLILLLIGIVLQMSKLLSVGKVWNWWFYAWTGENNFQVSSEDTYTIDTEDFNFSTYFHAAFESLPQLIIQSYNGFLLGKFNTLTVVSICFSGWQVFSTVFPLPFYLSTAKMAVMDIPVQIKFLIFPFNAEFPPRKKENKINFWRFALSCFPCCLLTGTTTMEEDDSFRYSKVFKTDDQIIVGSGEDVIKV